MGFRYATSGASAYGWAKNFHVAVLYLDQHMCKIRILIAITYYM